MGVYGVRNQTPGAGGEPLRARLLLGCCTWVLLEVPAFPSGPASLYWDPRPCAQGKPSHRMNKAQHVDTSPMHCEEFRVFIMKQSLRIKMKAT